MQKVLTKYWLVVHVGLLLWFPWNSLLQTGISGFSALFWLSLAAFEVALLLPSVRRGETLVDARRRVVRNVLRDPFFYLGLSFLLFMVVQSLNGGCTLIYLDDADVWQFTPPVVSWAPFSIEPQSAWAQLSIMLASFTCCLCLRHAMSRTGKRYLLKGAVILSGFVAVVLSVQVLRAGLGYANVGPGHLWLKGGRAEGAFFGFWMLLGFGVFVEELACGVRGTWLVLILGVFGNALGMLVFSEAFFALACVILTAPLFVYLFLYVNSFVPKHVQLQYFLASVVLAACLAGVLVYISPQNPVSEKIKMMGDLNSYVHGLKETKNVRSAAAIKIWQDHPWGGVGADGFRHFVGSVVGDKEWKLIKQNQAHVYNDSLQFLCEYGLLGFGLLLSSVVMLLASVLYRVRIAWKYGVGDGRDAKFILLRISPIVLTGGLATCVCFVESWVGSPLRLPSLLISWSLILSAMPAFLPEKVPLATQGARFKVVQ